MLPLRHDPLVHLRRADGSGEAEVFEEGAEGCAAEEIGGWYDGATRTGELLVLLTPIDLHAIGAEGVRWWTKRDSWDGMRNVRVDSNGGVIKGEALALDDDWTPFEVDLRSGAVKGGSYLEH